MRRRTAGKIGAKGPNRFQIAPKIADSD